MTTEDLLRAEMERLLLSNQMLSDELGRARGYAQQHASELSTYKGETIPKLVRQQDEIRKLGLELDTAQATIERLQGERNALVDEIRARDQELGELRQAIEVAHGPDAPADPIAAVKALGEAARRPFFPTAEARLARLEKDVAALTGKDLWPSIVAASRAKGG